MFQGDAMVDRCSKLNLTTDLNQSSQIYYLSCNDVEGDMLSFTKPAGAGGIAIWEVVAREAGEWVPGRGVM